MKKFLNMLQMVLVGTITGTIIAIIMAGTSINLIEIILVCIVGWVITEFITQYYSSSEKA